MSNIWFISDTHFNHANFLNFVDSDGKKIRPFDDVGQMDDYMITRWNERVKDGDKVYHLGDVGMNSAANSRILPQLNGKKNLIIGNHDTIKGDLLNYFKKIVLWRVFKEYDFVLSHIPLREDSMMKVTFNLHGHIHQQPSPSIRHMNMCVEHHDYSPVHLDDILVELANRRKVIASTQT